jgi:hypothetical protein
MDMVMVFNATFNNMSAISWRTKFKDKSVLHINVSCWFKIGQEILEKIKYEKLRQRGGVKSDDNNSHDPVTYKSC